MNPRKRLTVALCALMMVLGAGAFGVVADAQPVVCWTHNSAGGQGFDSAQAACDAACARYSGCKAAKAIESTPGSNSYGCYQLVRGRVFPSPFNQAYPKDIDPHCYTQVSGPYSNIPDTPSQGMRGAEFNSGHRKKIKDCNGRFNRQGSQAGLVSDLKKANKFLYQLFQIKEECEELIDEPLLKNNPCFAQVHHVVPARDTYGCRCGTNSNQNAVLISKRLNGLLNNLPRSPQLVDYVNGLKKFPCGGGQAALTFPFPGYLDLAAGPAAPQDSPDGGCAEGGGLDVVSE